MNPAFMESILHIIGKDSWYCVSMVCFVKNVQDTKLFTITGVFLYTVLTKQWNTSYKWIKNATPRNWQSGPV